MTTAALPATPSAPTPRKFTRQEFYAMGDLGMFSEQRVVLIDGEIIQMPPQKSPHAYSVLSLGHLLRQVFDEAHFIVRPQLPLALGEHSEPEPDLAVIEGSLDDWRGKEHPRTALLVVEVSDSTLRDDRLRKRSLYASVPIQDYWIVNLVDRQIEVYRRPAVDSAAEFGFSYDRPIVYRVGQSLSPLAKPDALIQVKDVLP